MYIKNMHAYMHLNIPYINSFDEWRCRFFSESLAGVAIYMRLHALMRNASLSVDGNRLTAASTVTRISFIQSRLIDRASCKLPAGVQEAQCSRCSNCFLLLLVYMDMISHSLSTSLCRVRLASLNHRSQALVRVIARLGLDVGPNGAHRISS